MMTVNILGDSQREQWHSVVRMLNHITNYKADEICKELDRYIDFCEDIFDEMREDDD